jgi:DNA-binding transcriptional ArsR family regulator
MKLSDGIDVYTAIAHPARRRILDALREEPLPVHVLAAPFAMSRPAISQHLKLLREAGLVSEVRSGRERRYQLQPQRLQEIADWLAHYEQFWTSRLRNLGAYLDEHHDK